MAVGTDSQCRPRNKPHVCVVVLSRLIVVMPSISHEFSSFPPCDAMRHASLLPQTMELIIHACGHDGSANKFLLCESVQVPVVVHRLSCISRLSLCRQALVLAALRNPNLDLEKVTVGDGAEVRMWVWPRL